MALTLPCRATIRSHLALHLYLPAPPRLLGQILGAVRRWVQSSRPDVRAVLGVPPATLRAAAVAVGEAMGDAEDYWSTLPDPLAALRAVESHWLCVLGGMERMMACELRAVSFFAVRMVAEREEDQREKKQEEQEGKGLHDATPVPVSLACGRCFDNINASYLVHSCKREAKRPSCPKHNASAPPSDTHSPPLASVFNDFLPVSFSFSPQSNGYLPRCGRETSASSRARLPCSSPIDWRCRCLCRLWRRQRMMSREVRVVVRRVGRRGVDKAEGQWEEWRQCLAPSGWPERCTATPRGW